MIGAFFLIGIVSTAFLMCLTVSPGIISGTVRRLSAHRIGLLAYHEARRAAMRSGPDYERLVATVLERSA